MRLLLDAHIRKTAVAALQRRLPRLDAVHIADWRGGAFRTAEDAAILAACFEDSRILVTYDLRTVPGLLRQYAAENRSHAGVIFGDRRSVPPNNPNAVARALAVLAGEIGERDMTNAVRFLRSAPL